MNVSNGTSGQNGNIPNGMNPTGQPVQAPQQSIPNTQQPNLTKPNGQVNTAQPNMGNAQQGYPQQPGMGYQQTYQQAPNMNPNTGYQQNMGTGYTQPVYPVMPAKSTLGLVGLILSILSLICCGPVLAIPGLICSIIALVKNKKETRALIGTIIGVISIVLWVILWFTGVVSLNSLSFTDSDGNEYDIIEEVEDDDYYNEDNDYSDDGDYNYEDEEDIIVEVDNEEVVEDDEEIVEDAGNVGTDVATDFHPSSVVYNGITLNIGEYTAAELEDVLGYTFDEEDMSYVVNPGYYTYTSYWVERSNWDDEEEHFDRIIYFYFVNDTEEAIPMSDCVLYKLDFYSSDYFDGDTLADWCNLDLGSGITLDMSPDDIKDIFGEPDSDYENEEYNTCSLKYYKMYDYMWSVEFDFKDGKLTELTIGAY